MILHLLLLGSFLSCFCLAGETVELQPGSTIELAEVDAGARLLGAVDAYLRRMSPYDREVRMRVTEPPTVEAFAAHCARHAQAFSEEDLTMLRTTFAKIGAAVQPLGLAFPPRITIVKTDGGEDVGFPYCRGPVIVLPGTALGKATPAFQRMLTHELFHIFSSHHPEKRKALYGLLGFLPCGELQLPPAQDRRRFTNPDAMNFDYYLPLKGDDAPGVTVIPLLLGKSDHYDAKRGLFENVDFLLAEVEVTDAAARPVLNAHGLAVLSEPSPAFLRQMSQNTDYIWHPEEVLADNFVHVVFPGAKLKNPDLPTRLLEVMRSGK